MSNLYTIYRTAVKALSEAGCDSPEFDAQQLVEFCLGYSKTQLLLNTQTVLDDTKLIYFNDCVKRRCLREPLQYILGFWDFYRFRFKVGEGVLIPRPETELLPEFAVKQLRKTGGAVVYDLCCGSGCIGLSVAKLFPNIKVFCIDISDKAIEYTKENAERLGLYNVTVLKRDVLEPISALELPRPDIILSNPPYVPSAEIQQLQPEIAFEPSLALDGGEDGLVFYKALAENWFPFVAKGGFLAMECGENQAKDILSFFLDTADGAKIIKDHSDIDRVVVIRR